MGQTCRVVYKYMNSLKPNDKIQTLSRKEQVTIFGLRTQHAPLNYNLNRINPQHPPMCPLCNDQFETTDHLLLHCPNLDDLRQDLLPPTPDITNILYSTTDQLKNTSKFYHMAMAEEQTLTGCWIKEEEDDHHRLFSKMLYELVSLAWFASLKEKFQQTFGAEPEFFARAPGRVNLIGEHIDYCGYSVLPMAIEQDIVMAVSPDETGKLTFVNMDSHYKEFQGDVMQISITKDAPAWYKYMLCGVLGVKENFCSLVINGFKAVVSGTIPPSAGLSSSSALVCCAAMAMLRSNSWPMSKEKLCEVCARCEHYIGTEGGGMDQAISLTANAGQAKHIEFNPLRTTDVQLPQDIEFIVSNSLAEMNKAATPYYNIRVVECRIATQVATPH
ncbi:N-acetylgalactosamine kinase [Elysia marginata]|uniref:N-acetylgalactosamine kinase n=1 Tax=Elysia marginata TaxID=1093978 RepID=A0AAV4FKA3_9GAST|nr:N-acetylgalactosamine kinase [Elysia marginata]